MFVFQADPPDPTKIPVADVVGVTVVLLTCAYRGKEFVRVGYYVNNEYTDGELRENPSVVPQFDKLQRNILATNPRVTRFKIDWADNTCEESGNDTQNNISNLSNNGCDNGNANSSNSSHHISGKFVY